MDLMFDDEGDELGSDIEAYCPRCKADTAHVVVTKYEDEVRRVQCGPCGDVHSYRKPRGEIEEDIPEPVASKKRAGSPKPTWREAMAKRDGQAQRFYSFRDTYKENDIIQHRIFGSGLVSEVLSDNKVEVTFEQGRKILIHNRPEMVVRTTQESRTERGVREGLQAARLRAKSKSQSKSQPKSPKSQPASGSWPGKKRQVKAKSKAARPQRQQAHEQRRPLVPHRTKTNPAPPARKAATQGKPRPATPSAAKTLRKRLKRAKRTR